MLFNQIMKKIINSDRRNRGNFFIPQFFQKSIFCTKNQFCLEFELDWLGKLKQFSTAVTNHDLVGFCSCSNLIVG